MDESRHPSQPAPDPGKQPAASSPSPREIERASLRSLRDHVAKAVEEIVRLRAQNKSLVRRLSELEASLGKSGAVFDDGADVKELKTRISSFISSIDKYLAEGEDA